MKPQYRNLIPDVQSPLLVSLFIDREFPAAWHFHPQYELTFIVSSMGMRYVGDSVQHFSPGDFVLIGSNLPHSWKTVGEQKTNVKCIIAQWNEDLLGEKWLTKPDFQSIDLLLKRSSRGIKFSKIIAKEFYSRMLELVTMPPFEKLISTLSILHSLSLKNNYTLLASPGINNLLTTEDSNRISLVHSYIREHVRSNITLSDVAPIIGLTKESFCRYFKKKHKKNFTTFLNEYKVALASKLLVETDFSVSNIGYECGYNSISFFHRQFSRVMKMTPKQYRDSYTSI